MELKNIEISQNTSTIAGSLHKVEYISVGVFQGCEIQKVINTDLITNSVTNIARLELTKQGDYGVETKIAALTYQEVKGLLGALNAFMDRVLTTHPSNYTEVNYVTNDFKAGCYYSSDKWTVYLKLAAHDDNSYMFIQHDSIPHFIKLLENIK